MTTVDAFWACAARQVEDARRDDLASWAAYRAESREWEAMSEPLPDDDIPEAVTPA